MMAMFFAFQATGTLSYSGVNARGRARMAQTTATAIALLLFIGACGKSAQLPLYLWLPDAMEGPTPVSALIHAATMVTAGVFLMCRISPMLDAASSYAPTLIAIVGAATALFAATIAVAQNDIKKVLAYSTVSQLGYMFLAVGSGAYVAAIFHMVTHAFFKALLFLGSGSVIHGMHDEQDMRRMGALRKLMPITAVTFIVGWLAIAGVPPFAGFWSKDDILLAAYDKSPVLWALGLVTALLTAYYMTRQVIMVFYGKARWNDAPRRARCPRRRSSPHESPAIMLSRSSCCRCCRSSAACSTCRSTTPPRSLTHWLEPVVESAERTRERRQRSCRLPGHRHRRRASSASPLAVPGLREAQGRSRSSRRCSPTAGTTTTAVSRVHGWARARGFEAVAWFDANVVDGAVNGVGGCVRGTAQRIRTVQSGNVRNYAAAIGVGVVLLLAWFVVVRGISVMLVPDPHHRSCWCRPSGRSLVALLLEPPARVGQAHRPARQRAHRRASASGCWSRSTSPTPASSSSASTRGSSRGASRGTSASTASRCSSWCSPACCSRSSIAGTDPHHDHKRYLAWMLLLEAGLMGSFISLDLFLFFVFFEIVLVPMYFLIAGWGYEGRVYAADEVLPLHDGRFGVHARRHRRHRVPGKGQRAADVRPHRDRQGRFRAGDRPMVVLRIRRRVRGQGTDLPVAHVAARRAYASTDRRLGHPRRRHAEARYLRPAALRCLPVPRGCSMEPQPVV